MDRARAVLVPGKALSGEVRESLAASASEAAFADLDSFAGFEGDDRLGLASGPALHLPADVQPGEGRGAIPEDVSGHLPGIRLPAEGFTTRLGRTRLRRERRRKRPEGSKGAF